MEFPADYCSQIGTVNHFLYSISSGQFVFKRFQTNFLNKPYQNYIRRKKWNEDRRGIDSRKKTFSRFVALLNYHNKVPAGRLRNLNAFMSWRIEKAPNRWKRNLIQPRARINQNWTKNFTNEFVILFSWSLESKYT